MTEEAKKKKGKKERHHNIIFQLDKIKYWCYENYKLLRAILEELRKEADPK